MTMKTCSKCHESKHVDDFGKDASKSDGRTSFCRACKAQSNLTYRTENRSAYLLSKRLSRQRNLQSDLEYKRQRYADNRQELIEYQAEYARRNPLKRAKIRSAYRARKLAQVFFVSDKEIQAIRNSCCYACGTRERIQIDHIIPLSRGGRHSIGNLMPLCHSCNASKNARLLIEWKAAGMRKHLLCSA